MTDSPQSVVDGGRNPKFLSPKHMPTHYFEAPDVETAALTGGLLQLRFEVHAGMCTRSRPAQPLIEPDWRSSSDLTCISSSTRTWDRAAGERDQRSGEIELAEKNRIEPFVLLDLAVLVIRFPSSSFSPLTCCRGTTLCGGQSLLSPELHDHAPRGLLMTSKFDPDGGVKRRTLEPSQSGIAPAGDLEGVAGQNSCFLRSQPPEAPLVQL